MKPLYLKAFVLISLIALPSLGATQSERRIAAGPYECAIHFQARAMWMHGLDGQPETIAMMARYADILWLSTPRDWGMPVLGRPYNQITWAYDNEVLRVLTQWADDGYGDQQRPICTEDAKCVHCLEIMRSTVIASD